MYKQLLVVSYEMGKIILLLITIVNVAAIPDQDSMVGCCPLSWDGLYESTQRFKREVILEMEKAIEELGDPAEKLQVMLYTRKNPTRGQILYPNDSNSIRTSHFDPQKTTKMIVHGWVNSFESPFPTMVKIAYLTRYDTNVLLVDWSDVSHWLYPSARSAVPLLAEALASFIRTLISHGLQPSQLHIVGHSLGAHLAGIAGLQFNRSIYRITGLDPASPLFSVSDEKRLKNTSAAFVDVIHTSGLLLGFFSPIGQVDFYPNGGLPIQPGCGFDVEGICSHSRSYRYFSESILTPEAFMGVACPHWSQYKAGECTPGFAEMGENVPRSARGVYYLETFSEYPFGRGRMDFP